MLFVVSPFSPDGKTLASASRDHTIRFWDPVGGVEKAIIDGHIEWINSVAFSPYGSLLASGSDDETLRLWDLYTYTESQTFSGHEYLIEDVAFSPDGEILASASQDERIFLVEYECWYRNNSIGAYGYGYHIGVCAERHYTCE